jgi:hypothetical protein
MTWWVRAAAVTALGLASACAARRPSLPSGPGTPFPDFPAAFEQASTECRNVASMTASFSLSGRSGSTRLRGRIDAGLASPARVRLEGFPPVVYGSKPFFILVATGDRATLLLPRDDRVLRDAPPAAIVEALAGVALGPADLRAVLAGCGLGGAAPGEGRSYGNDWAAAGGTDGTVYLQRIDGRWQIAAASRGNMTIQYTAFENGRAQTINIRTATADRATSADLTLRVSEAELNVPLGDPVFELQVPASAEPLTLEELRRSGPLGGGGV